MSQQQQQRQLSLEQFIDIHKPQLQSSSVPERYWESLYKKLQGEVFDAGQKFQLCQVVYETELENGNAFSWQVVTSAEEGVDPQDPNCIYLVDHAWTFRASEARQQLTSVPPLLTRMAGLLDLDTNNVTSDQLMQSVLDNVWRFANTYSLGHLDRGSREAQPIWYVMDEFGARIQHSDEPTCRLVPFLHAQDGAAYSIMWPTKPLEHGDELCRDYAEGEGDDVMRELRLLPWRPRDLTSTATDQPDPGPQFYEAAALQYLPTPPGQDYFEKIRPSESLPLEALEEVPVPEGRKLRVYTEIENMQKHVGSARLEVVDTTDAADLIVPYTAMKDFRKFSMEHPGQFVLQFPCEYLITCKDLFSLVGRRAARPGGAGTSGDEAAALAALEYNPPWLPVTFNLETELPQFVSYFQQREKCGLENTWICKPWTRARSLDLTVSRNLAQIIRIRETGPKVASLYLSDGVLFYRDDIAASVKFDVRFNVALASVHPLRLYCPKFFFTRLANRGFDMEQLDDHVKHTTCPLYIDGETQAEPEWQDFVREWDKQYPEHTWATVTKVMHAAMVEFFTAAGSQTPPAGLAQAPQSRAIYGIDVMFRWVTDDDGVKRMSPVLLECNFQPDTERQCTQYPDIYNDLLSCLFFEDFESRMITRIA